MISELPCIINGYTFFKLIGKGGFSSVYLVRSSRFDFPFCAKVTLIPNNETTDENWKTIDNEIKALMTLNHPHIIRLYDHFHDNSHFYIILEYCAGGSLQNELPKNKGLTVSRFKVVTNQIISALLTCHKNNIAHHDLKLGNILLDEYKRVKLADFGISIKTKTPNELSESYSGSIQYESPEILNKVPHDPFKADIWALGVLFAHLISGKSPWRCDTIGKLKRCIMNATYYLPSKAPPEIADIIKQMIILEPEKRISMNDLARMPFFQEGENTNRVPTYFDDCMSTIGRKLFPVIVTPQLIITEEEELPELTMDELAKMEEVPPISYKTSKVLNIFERNLRGMNCGLPAIRTRYHSFDKVRPTFADSYELGTGPIDLKFTKK